MTLDISKIISHKLLIAVRSF